MSDDTLVRTIAVAAAAAILAAPYWERLAALGAQAAAAASEHWAAIARLAAAGLIVAAAWGKVPMPRFTPPAPVVTVTVETPSVELQQLVAPVASALGPLSQSDRMLWASVWTKAALVVDAERTSQQPAFTDTPALRLFTTVALDIAWRRIGGHAPGSLAGLREAVEAAMRGVVGLDSVPVTADVRARYSEVCRAIAWAGIQR